MKKILFAAAAALLVAGSSCSNGMSSASTDLKTVDDSLSYYIGSFYGSMVKQQIATADNKGFNENQFLEGVKNVLEVDTANGSKADGMGVGLNIYMTAKQMAQRENVELNTKQIYAFLEKAVKDSADVDPQTANIMIQQLMMKKKENSPEAVQNAKAGEQYISELMAKDPEVKKTNSGLAYKVVKEGNGKKFVVSDRINVIYKGTKIDGKEFDSSKGEATQFSPAQVVPGFKEGLLMMSPGAEYILYIPGKLAYGPQGTPSGEIGPNETLVFEVSTPSLYVDKK